jgi:YesN/AraC family two-component response regulator
MRYYFLLFLSFAAINVSLSQTEEQLSQLSFDAIEDSINKYMVLDLSKALKASNAYILKGKREKDQDKQWQGMAAITYSYFSHRDFNKANDQYEKLLAFAQENNLPHYVAQSYNLAGHIQMSLPNLKEAIRYYNLSLKTAENENDEIGERAALSSLSYVYRVNNDYKEALKIEKTTLQVITDKPVDSIYTDSLKSQAISTVNYNLSNIYTKLNQLDSAKYYSALIKEFKKDKDSCYMRKYYLSQYDIALEEDKYDKARKNLVEAEKYCSSFEGALVPLRMASRYGSIALKEKNYDEAARKFLQGLRDYQVSPEEEGYMRDYYKKLADALTQTGDFEKANYYFEKYFNTEKEYSKITTDVSTSLREKEREQFNNEIEKVKAEREEKQSYLNYLLLGGSIIILTLLFLLLKFYRTKKADELKFEALLTKIKAAKTPSEIIDTKDEVLEEKATSDVSNEVTQQILDGLKKLEQKEYFLKQDCNSYNVAKKINTNTSYLSKVINSHYGKNFNTYINDLRINYAIVRLKNDVFFRSFSIQAIAEEVGYKSADSFSKYFKKDTGLNPSFYIKNIKNVT